MGELGRLLCRTILEVFWDNLWTLSFGLSQFHGHDSWLVYEVALSITVPYILKTKPPNKLVAYLKKLAIMYKIG